MKVPLVDIKKYIPSLSWSADELAEKLSLIGHEAETAGESLDITLTANRKDCQQLSYLLFDLMAIYPELGSNAGLVELKPGKVIQVTLQQVNDLLGSSITKEQYKRLTRLGFEVGESEVTAPDFRTDVFEAADIAEEAFRLVGIQAIGISMLAKQDQVASKGYQAQQNIRAALVDNGMNEIRTVSFAANGEIAIKNPFSNDLPYLRPNLLEGLLQALAKNPFIRRAAFFEIGDVFIPGEQTNIGVIFSGNKNKESLEESLHKTLGTPVSLVTPEADLLHRYNVKQPNIFYGEVPIANVKVTESTRTQTALPAFKKLSKFPSLVRDISLDSGNVFETESIHSDFPELLFVEKVDSYTNPDTEKTSDTYRLIFQKHDESFTQEEIAKIDSKIQSRFFASP